MTTDDIVVVGRRAPAATGGGVVTVYSVNPNMNEREPKAYDPGAYKETGELNVSVRVKVSSNAEKAREAAKNVAEALGVIIEAATKLPSNTQIALPDGKTTTAGQLLSDIKNTKFVITDVANPANNKGVGGADRANMTDTLYFAAFVEGSGQSSYTNAQWSGQGLVGILLHEMGHLSSAGNSVYNSERSKWAQENGKFKRNWRPDDFWTSNYSNDNELYQHGFALASAAALGIGLDKYDTIFKGQYDPDHYRGAAMIYAENTAE